jgi:probable HAF family extracellular repeat protein
MKTKLLGVAAVLAFLGASSPVNAQYSFVTIDYPSALAPFGSFAMGINDAGQIAYFDSLGGHAFLYNSGVYSSLSAPLSTDTRANGINNAGQIVGTIFDGSGGHAFLYSGGVFNALNPPGANGIQATDINNSGKVIGSSNGNGGNFLYDYHTGVYTPAPSPTPGGGDWGINDAGHIAGVTDDAGATFMVSFTAAASSLHSTIRLRCPFLVDVPPPKPMASTTQTLSSAFILTVIMSTTGSSTRTVFILRSMIRWASRLSTGLTILDRSLEPITTASPATGSSAVQFPSPPPGR